MHRPMHHIPTQQPMLLACRPMPSIVVAVAALAAAVKCVFNRRRRRKRLQEAREGKVDDPPLTSLPLRSAYPVQ